MADVVIPRTVYCFALMREAEPFLKRLLKVRRIKDAPCLAWEAWSANREATTGKSPRGAAVLRAPVDSTPPPPSVSPPLILVTGVGRSSTLAALEWASRFPVDSLTVVGFCGALTPSLRVGDVLHFVEVIDESATVHPCDGQGRRLLTTASMIAEPVEKKRLAERYAADAVDMESVVAVRWCNERGIPVRVVRAISDGVETELSPRLTRMLAGGKPSLLKVLGQLARSPRLLPELLRLARDTQLAAEMLADELVASLRTAG